MQTVFLHGLGQMARDWAPVAASFPDTDVPELFEGVGKDVSYSALLGRLERQCAGKTAPFCLCGLSLGATLALDYAIRHPHRVASLLLIAPQYKVPTRLIDLQNVLFFCMPPNAFAGAGLPKEAMIRLTHSMRRLDFTDSLHRITCPAVILCGERDRANRKAARSLAARLPRACLRIVPGAGHELNRDAPQAIVSALGGPPVCAL